MTVSIETLEKRAAKLAQEIEDARYDEFVQTRIPEAVKLRDDHVQQLQRRIDEQKMNAAERANFRAQLDAVQATVEQATDKYEAQRLELRGAISSHDSTAIGAHQHVVTQALFNVRALQQTAEEIAAELNGVLTDDDEQSVEELEQERDLWAARTPLEMAEDLVAEEDRQIEMRAAEMARGAALYMANHKSADLLAREAADRQAAWDKKIQATPYVPVPW
jgi:hypothetical protein